MANSSINLEKDDAPINQRTCDDRRDGGERRHMLVESEQSERRKEQIRRDTADRRTDGAG